MAKIKQVGLFWGETKILCVDIINEETTRILSIPVGINSEHVHDENKAELIERAASELESFLKNNRVKADEFNLALPTRDIIFRSFVIPWMPTNEIKGVVDFEASKYIPFSLEELKYAYHAIPSTEGNVKRLRVVFVAIRNDTLNLFLEVLNKASINVKSIEPAQIALIRTLTAKNALPENDVVAIVEQASDSGKITIVHKKVPLFVRDFQIKAPSANMNAEQAEQNKFTKFVNEIKISLDYFARQDNNLATTQIVLITNNLSDGIRQQMSDDLHVEVTAFSSKQLIGNQDAGDTNYLYAHGATIFDEVEIDVDINFSNIKLKKAKAKKKSGGKINFNFKTVIPVLLACAALVGGVFFLTQKTLKVSIEEIDQYKTDLGDYIDQEAETIELKNAKMAKKQKNYEKIRINSDIKDFLALIPELMPEGAWLDNFQISYKESGSEDKAVITLSGYVYHENVNEQFRMIPKFQRNLKNNNEMSEFFKNIDILTTDSKKLNNFDVTYFQIKCW